MTETKNSNICLDHYIRFKCPNVVFRDLARVTQCTHKMYIIYVYIQIRFIHIHIILAYILYYLHIYIHCNDDTIIPGRECVKLFMGDGSAAAGVLWSLVFVAVV